MALTTAQKDLVKWALDAFNTQPLRHFALWEQYYRGTQPLNINLDLWRRTFGDAVTPPTENLCVVCVDVLADLMQIERFAAVNKSDEETALLAQEVWRRNRMEERAGQLHKSTFIYREAYAVVWPDDEGEPVIYPNTPLNVIVRYHPEKIGYITQGAKMWIEGGYTRLTLYTRDEIIRLRSKSKSISATITAASFDLYDDGEVPPLAANPYDKVPIFRFVNNAAIGGTGTSEVQTIQASQDTLNGALVNKAVTREYISYPQKYAIGLEVKYDIDGNPIQPYTAAPNNVWVMEANPNASTQSFGSLSQGSLADHIQEATDARMQIARQSGVPPHYFNMDSGGWPSGESLKTASTRLTAKVLDRMTSFGNSWADTMRFCLEIKGRAGVEIETLWTDPTPRLSELESWQAALAEQQAGGSRKRALAARGYSEQEIEDAQLETMGDGFPAMAGEPATGEPQAGTVAETTLNGAQITAALSVIEQLSTGKIEQLGGVELLVAVGIPRDKAEAMADEAVNNPQEPPAALAGMGDGF